MICFQLIYEISEQAWLRFLDAYQSPANNLI